VLVHNPWLLALDAVLLGLVSGQLGFQLHDAAHRQMFESALVNRWVGLLTGDLLLGMSYGWWYVKHNRHHANPNDVDEDPDIQSPAIVYSREQALARRGPLRALAAYQAFFFFPLLFLLGFSMHGSSYIHLAGREARHRKQEIVLLALHNVLYFGFLLLVLHPWMALVVIVLHRRRAPPRLPPCPGPDGAQRARQPGQGFLVWIAELPDRAPPVPHHAPAQPAPGPPPDQDLLRGDRGALLRSLHDQVVSRTAGLPARGGPAAAEGIGRGLRRG